MSIQGILSLNPMGFHEHLCCNKLSSNFILRKTNQKPSLFHRLRLEKVIIKGLLSLSILHFKIKNKSILAPLLMPVQVQARIFENFQWTIY